MRLARDTTGLLEPPPTPIHEKRVRVLVMLSLYGYSAPLRDRWAEDGHEARYAAYLGDPRHSGKSVRVNDEAAMDALANEIISYQLPGEAIRYAAE
jgi:hypothetical protein